MKTIARKPDGSFAVRPKVRWSRPSDGARLVLLDDTLWVAGRTGEYRVVSGVRVGRARDYALRHGFVTVVSDRIAAESGSYVGRPERELAALFRFVPESGGRGEVFESSAPAEVLSRAPLSLPASSVRETEGEAAYLALIEGHARRVAAAGWGGSQGGRPPIDAPPRVPKVRGSCRLRPETRLAMLPDWLHVSYCAGCRLLLRCVEQPERPAKMDRVLRRKVNRVPLETRLHDRPYCPRCVPSRTLSA